MTSQEEIELKAATPSAFPRSIAAMSQWLGIIAVIIMLVIVNFEVIGRSFFGYATIWVTEVSTYLVVAITFLGAAFVRARDANVNVDVLLL